MDLFGQVCAESIGTKQYSGVGGQVDFVRGACNSKGGKSIISMLSTAKNETISKIKLTLTEGSIVTTSRNEVDYIANLISDFSEILMNCITSVHFRINTCN